MEFITVISTSLLSSGAVIAYFKLIANTSSKIFTDRLIERFKAENSVQLEKLKSELSLEIEGAKSKLKNSELIFSQRLKASAEFSLIIRSLLPKSTFPNMDWSDACDYAAYGLESFSEKMRDFLTTNKYILPEEVYSIAYASAGTASELAHEVSEDISPSLNTSIGQLISNLFDAELILFKEIKDGYLTE